MVTNIVDLIPTGKANAIKRDALLDRCVSFGLATNDRTMRGLIEDARKQNVILNMQDGSGYFLPSKDDKQELNHYIMQEAARSMTISRNLRTAKNLLADIETGRI